VRLIVLSPMKPGDNICRVLTLMFNLREAYGGRRAWVWWIVERRGGNGMGGGLAIHRLTTCKRNLSPGLETRFLGRVNVPMFMDCLSQRPSEAVVSNPRLYNIQIERQYHH